MRDGEAGNTLNKQFTWGCCVKSCLKTVVRTLFKGHTSTISACRTSQDMNDANESSSSTMATAHPTSTFFKHAVTLERGWGGIGGGQSVAFAHPLSLSHFLPHCKNRSLGPGLRRNCFATNFKSFVISPLPPSFISNCWLCPLHCTLAADRDLPQGSDFLSGELCSLDGPGCFELV